jgi:uncharacterized protein YbbC (DUF1343 family)
MTKTGLDVLVHGQASFPAKQRVGLVSMPAAVMPDLTSSLDALRKAGINVTALFGPEHGFGGAALDGATVGDVTDPRSGLPIFSLYGQHYEPTPEMLAGIDAFVFDMQDVGVRFYTYLSTLFYILKAAGKNSKAVYVLDRPNPITGEILEGGEVEPGFESFVGIVNVPIRHGMTLGELAQFMNAEHALGADLHTIAMKNWRREMWFDETGLLWVPTSPAMPHFSTTVLYPGMCLLEGTNLSLGRGTSLPFEICGAPGLAERGYALAEEMNALCLPGVRFRPIVFTPSASNHAGSECQGVQVHIVDKQVFRPITMAINLIAIAQRMTGEAWAWNPHFDRLAGGSGVRSALAAGTSVPEIISTWDESITRFIKETYWVIP